MPNSRNSSGTRAPFARDYRRKGHEDLGQLVRLDRQNYQRVADDATAAHASF
jgi:hypothetical protein